MAAHLVAVAFVCALAGPPARADMVIKRAGDTTELPSGTEVVPFEDVDGHIVFRGTVRTYAGQDSNGTFILDTGVGSLMLDHAVARALKLMDGPGPVNAVAVADRMVSRFEAGGLSLAPDPPQLTFDGHTLAQASDRAPLGLFGPRLFPDCVLLVDYRKKIWAVVPRHMAMQDAATKTAPAVPGGTTLEERGRISASRAGLGGLITASSISVPFRLVADGRILVRA